MLKETDLAIKYIKKCLEIKPDFDEAINNLANLYKEEKNYTKAIEYYRLASSSDPKNSMYMNNLADTLRVNGKLKEAVEVLKSSLK